MGQIKAGVAALKVMESWGIKRVYGIPAGSFNSWMDAFSEEQGNIDFIQVKHEEIGSLAAVMQPKFGGSIGVAMGSGGPGATHLSNGIYEAAQDHTPMLAILGGKDNKDQNLDAFQEMNQNPMYNDPAIYNRKVAYAEQLPMLVDEAIRRAYADKGPAVLEVPADFGFTLIDEDAWRSSANSAQVDPKYVINDDKISEAADILNKAKRPVIYAGVGTHGSGEDVVALSRKLKAPLLISGINYDNFDGEYEGLMGAMFRVAEKPANEVIREADVILWAGSNWPFAGSSPEYLANLKKVIQIDINPRMLGKRMPVDVAILGDAGDNIRAITEKVEEKEASPWWKATVANNKNWRAYKQKMEEKTTGDLQLYQVYNAINKYSDADAIYSIDVGDSTQTSIRHLRMTDKNIWKTSPLFATMGVGLPGAMAASLDHPGRQTWSLAGDGAFSMGYHDLVTAVRYGASMINVIFANNQYGFIKDKYEDTNETTFGTEFPTVDFAKIAEAQGAVGYVVDTIEQLDDVFAKAVQDEKDGKVVVIQANITRDRPMPVENLTFDNQLHNEADIAAYKKRYEAEDVKPLREFLEAEGLESQYIAQETSK